jgi:hypothetical protein
MSGIKQGVYAAYLNFYRDHEPLLKAFSDVFEISYGERYRSGTSDIGGFLLRPSNKIAQYFGFSRDLILVYAPYPDLQARTVRAAAFFAQEARIRERAERLVILLASDDPRCETWIRDYVAANPESHLLIPFYAEHLLRADSPAVYIINTLRKHLHAIDFFDDTLPLRRDTFFFGRSHVLMDLLSGLRNQVNRGLFGLRKIGKTSLLLKVEREFQRAGDGLALYLNCADPALAQCTAATLLDKVANEIAQKNSVPRKDFNFLQHPSERFREACRLASRGRPIALLFDEIEHISFLSRQYVHWRTDFLVFWQAVRAAQQVVRGLSIIICGVNASVCETPHVDESPNPLFGIFRSIYLQGLSAQDTADMVRQIGAPMGMVFEENSLLQLHSEYGGHPLLTRLACSFMHQRLARDNTPRPLTITTKNVRDLQIQRDQQIVFYCEYIVADIRQFYSAEFELLERVASGDILEFLDFFVEDVLIRHLIDYGLIENSPRPRIRIDVLGEFLRWQRAKREKRRISRDLIPVSQRPSWLLDRFNLILNQLRRLGEIQSKLNARTSILPREPFSQQEILYGCQPPDDKEDFLILMNRLYRVFIETQPFSRSEIFFRDFAASYPDLQKALHRIRVYRNWEHHSELMPAVREQLDKFLSEDLEGANHNTIPEAHFLLSQIALDELALAAIVEVSRRT